MQTDLFYEHESREQREEPFDLVLLDPPWKDDDGGGGRGAQHQYETHDKRRILEIVQGARWDDGSLVWHVADHAHMRLWCTTLSLRSALWLMAQLGFEYSTFDVWVKHGSWGVVQERVVALIRHALESICRATRYTEDGWVLNPLEIATDTLLEALDELGAESSDVGQMACGQYRRSAHEILLYGRRGPFAPGPLASSTTSLVGGRIIPAPRTRGSEGLRVHSRKPVETHAHVEATSPYMRRLSMFERGVELPGWRFWGDEVGKYDNPGDEENDTLRLQTT